MKISAFKLTAFGLCLAYALFCITAVWSNNLIDEELFFKITLTFIIIAGLMAAYYLLYHLSSEKELKDKNFIKD